MRRLLVRNGRNRYVFSCHCATPKARNGPTFAVQMCQGVRNSDIRLTSPANGQPARMWGEQSCAWVALRDDETLSGVVLLIRSAGTIGVPDGTDLRDGRSVTGGGGGAWAGSCSDSSLTWLLGSLTRRQLI